MNEKHISELLAEIKNWGPSPFYPENAEPVPIYFHNEVGGITGITMYSGFGERTPTYLLTTSFRLILYEKRKRGKDICRSYWHNVDFGEWRWQDKDGFIISGVKTTPIEFKDPTKETPYFAANWQTYFVSPSGDRKPLENVTVFLRHYYFHQEQRYAQWDEIVSLPNFKYRDKSSYPAVVPFCYKIKLQTTGTGTLDLDALWLLHTNPFQAGLTDVGYIPPDSSLHSDNVTSKRERHDFSKISHGARREGQLAKKVRKAARRILNTGDQAKDVIGTTQKTASAVKVRDEDEKAAKLTSKIRFCGNCGAPITQGANFCGKCGMGLAKKLLEEAKDELKGKLEEKVIEKVDEALDPGEEPKGEGESATQSKNGKSPSLERKPGATLQKGKCPQCNRRVQPKWRFCPDCSAPLDANR